MADEGLKIVNTVDNSQLERELKKSRKSIMSVAEAAEDAGARIDAAFKKLSQPNNGTSGYKEALETAKKMVKEIRKVFNDEIDLTNPSQELQKFDEQVVKMCGNLDSYFESLKAKLQDLLSVMGSGQNMTNNIPKNENNITQIEEIKRQNDELEAQIRKQTEEIARQQEQWRQLAEAVRTNNVAAVEKLTQETDEATKRLKLDSIKGSLKMLAGEMDDFAEKMLEAEGNVEILKARLDSLRGQGAGNEQIEQAEVMYGKALEKLEGMKTEYNMMSEQQKEYIDELQAANGHHVRMRTQIMNAREEMMQMIKSGQMGTPMFQKLAKEAGEMRKEMALANAYMQYYGTPNSHLAALKEGLQGVAGAAGLVIGVMGIFNEKSEKMAEIQTKIQAILGVIIGLETTYTAVKKTSNLMIAVSELQTWALVKAKQAEASATALATVRQAAYNLVAKANPYVLLASVIGLLVVGIYKLVSANKDAAESEKAHQKEIEKTRKAEESRLKTLGKHTGDLLAKYHALQRQWAALRTEAEKQEFLDSNISKFRELAGGVKDVSDAEKMLVELAPQVIAALKAVAEAEAYEEMYKDSIRKREEKWRRRVKSVATGDYYRHVSDDEKKGRTGVVAPKEWTDMGLEVGKDFTVRAKTNVNNEYKLTKEGIDKINRYREQQAIAQRDKMKKHYDEEVEYYEKSYDNAIENASKAKAATGLFEPKKEEKDTNKNFDKWNAYLDLLNEQKIKRERAIKDMELSTEQAEINALKEGSEKTVRQIHLDYEKKYEEIDRAYEDLRIKKIEEAKKLWEANPANKGKEFDYLSVDTSYTKEENDNYIAQLEANEAAYKESLHKFQVEDTKYQIEYLKNYGSFQEQKMAIAAEYDAKIAQESNDWAKKSLEEQKQKALDEIEMTRVKFNIDWGSVFSNLANRSINELEKIKRELESLSNSGEITDITQIKVLQDAIASLSEEFANRRGGFVALRDALRDMKVAANNLEKAEDELRKARESGNVEAIRAAEKEVALYRQRKATAEKSVDASKKAAAKLLKSIADIDFSSFSGVMGSLKNLAPSIDAVFKTNLNGIFLKLGDELTDAIGAFGDSMVQLGSAIGDLFGGKYDDTYIKKQLDMFDALRNSIDNLGEEINKGSLAQGISAYEEQVDVIKNQTKSAQETLAAAMEESYGSCWAKFKDRAFRSINYWIEETLNNEDWEILKNKYGVKSAKELWGLSPEQLKDISTHYGALWGKIEQAFTSQAKEGPNDNTGKNASDNALQALNNYLSLAGQLEDAERAIQARLTQFSFEDLVNDFKSALKEMQKDASDFSDDVADKFADALMNMRLTEEGGLNDQLKKWYDELANLLESKTKGEISEDEFANAITNLREAYVAMSLEGQELQKWANEIAGVKDNYKQEASSKGFQAMSQDTADELNGRFTAIQIGVYDIRDIATQAKDILTRMEQGQSTSISAIQDAVAIANAHLAAISKNTKKMTEFGEILEEIRDNTKNM